MTTAYRSRAVAAQSNDFPSLLRRSLDRYVQVGRDGIDRASIYEKKRPEDIVTRHFHMSDEVFDLGCAVHRSFPELDRRVWVAWMTNAHVHVTAERVSVYQQSRFFCDHADKAVGKAIAAHLGRPVRFLVDPAIKSHVEGV